MRSPVKIWRNQKKITAKVGKIGSIVSWTYIRVPPADFGDQAPYPVVIVQLKDDTRITAQLVDWEPKHLVFGQKVITIVRRIIQPNADGVILYGIKVKPIDESK